MKTITNNRLVLPDLLKGLAVLLMVQVHLTEIFANQVFYDSLMGKISLFLGGPPAAPLFMAVMGYFVAKKKIGFKLLIKRAFQLIFWGFLLNIGLNVHLFIRMTLGDFPGLSPFPYLFGVDILFLAGLSLLFIAIVSKFARNHLLIWIILISFFAIANPYFPLAKADQPALSYIFAYFWGFYHWSYFPVFPWMVYPLAGYLFYLLEERNLVAKIDLNKKWLLFGLLSMALMAGFQYAFSITTHLQAYYHHGPIYVLWTIGFLLWWLLLWYFVDTYAPKNQIIRYLQFVGINVTAFYVIQWLLIGNLGTLLYKTQGTYLWLVWFIAIMLLTTMIVKIYRKIIFRK